MPEYLIYFNQQWVGDHPPEWFGTRVEPSMAVVREMEEAGVWVFGGGLEELEDGARVFSADATSGSPMITEGPYAETTEHLGGFCVIDVPDDATAEMWAGKVAEGCGWPQEVRRFKQRPPG
jgi:hypothetical protein